MRNLMLKSVVIGCLVAIAGSHASAQEAERLFSRFDKNGDGAIGQDEMPEQARLRLMNRDKNGDGKVSREEMLAAQPGGNKGASAGGNSQAGNGNSKKRPNAAGEMPNRPKAGDRFKQILQRVDQNKDGVLELNEVPEKLRQRLANQDKNGDGKITAEEIQPMGAPETNRPAARRQPGAPSQQPGAGGKRPQAQGKKPGTEANNSGVEKKRAGADGQPSDAEARKLRSKDGAQSRFEQMLGSLPKNNAGLVDLGAIQDENRRNRLSQFDKNDDSLLDRQELRAIAEKFRSEGAQSGSDPKRTRKQERGAERAPQLPKRPSNDKGDGGNE